jgi:hypothetical protein
VDIERRKLVGALSSSVTFAMREEPTTAVIEVAAAIRRTLP